MALSRQPESALLIVAGFSRHAELLETARQSLEGLFGPVGLASLPYNFVQTKYYEPTMGRGLRKQLWAFHDLPAPDGLAGIKLRTNALERKLALAGAYPESRPVNLDPGLLTLGKFMLATTKDQAHRVYLQAGIFVEVTLRYQAGAFEPWPWTYADYRLPEVLSFLEEARAYYRRRLREGDYED
jgi:hypothetical protein